ncbi:hypothetical protein EHQ64_00070 [Leptospira sarikeiensis]|uniref:Uncharacterized protein n=1 Tax=Leptospira sarikeiensis TaxID=2484943 RepID=A0A4V6QMA4_9LEPT|nr:hypothetical protein EHQ64_00070 [Leptospira sarikeiensis]
MYDVHNSFIVLQLPSPSDNFVSEIDRSRFYQSDLQLLISHERDVVESVNIRPIPSAMQAVGLSYSDGIGNNYSVISGCDNFYPFPVGKKNVRLQITFQKPLTQGYKDIKVNEVFESNLMKSESLFVSLDYGFEKLSFNKKPTPQNILTNRCK